MKSLCANSLRYPLTNLALAIAVVLLIAAPAFAQGRGFPRESEAERNERILAEREFMLRSMGKGKKKDIQVEPQRLTLSQVKEDYEGLQLANNNILKMMSQSRELDEKVVFTATAEIRKRASRLKSFVTSLGIIEDVERKKEPADLDPALIRSSLLVLDASIMRVIENPIFKRIDKVVDVESSTKARNDLEFISVLSERVRRSIERTMKQASASR